MTDPLQLFDRLRPPESWSDPTEVDDDPVAGDILARVLDAEPEVDPSRRRRRTIAAAIVATAFVTGGAVAAVWNDDHGRSSAHRLVCWSDAGPHPAAALAVSWNGDADPTDRCIGAWAERGGHPAVAADLRACRAADGAVAVLPAPCQQVGLAQFAMTGAPGPDAADADRALASEFLARCIPLDAAEPVVRGVLDEHGLAGWTITIAGATGADEPCATTALDATSSTAFVRPAPAPG